MNEITRRVAAYILHDPVGNVEGYISNYDTSELQSAEDGGLLIIAEYNDRSRELVKAADVVEPQPEVNGITLVQPVYVDDRMKAVVGVFEALETELFSPGTLARTAAISEDPETGEVASVERSFAAALTALKSIVYEAATR